MLKITEIFSSFQGEGELSGEPSVFIRFSGCNLRCWFCDTPYSSWKPEGEMMEICEIINEVQQHEPEKVVITGGEPMLQPEVVPLSIKLKELGYHVTIETAGTVDRPVAADLMSISPKLENSTPQNANGWKDKHEAQRHKPEVIKRLLEGYNYQLKFVIDKDEDLTGVLDYLKEFPQIKRDSVYLMPQARTAEEVIQHESWLHPLAEKHGFHTTTRLHILRYGNKRKT